MSKPLNRIEEALEAVHISQMNSTREERARLKRYLANGKMSLVSIEAEGAPWLLLLNVLGKPVAGFDVFSPRVVEKTLHAVSETLHICGR